MVFLAVTIEIVTYNTDPCDRNRPMTAITTPTSRYCILSVVSLVLGLAALSPLLIMAGLPALLVGFYSLKRINLSDGRLKGRGLSIAGMLLGVLGSGFAMFLLGAQVVAGLREEAHGAECRNNLRRLGLAFGHYYDENRAYPNGTVTFNPDLAPEQRLSWVASLLPFLEPPPPAISKESVQRVSREREILDKLDFRQAWDAPDNRDATATALPFCICPCTSDLFAARNGAWTNYVGIAGVGRDAPLIPDFHLPFVVPKNPNVGMFGYDRFTKRADITAGISRTLMVVETSRDNGPWAQGGPSTVRGIDPDDDPQIGYDRPFGGLHPGGVYVLMVDASVQMMKDDTKPELWQDLARLSREAPPEPP
jgi:Protein of unknown function (DUF1559)